MFYVSISKTALDKVVEHAKSKGQEEVVGILTGRVIGQTVVVEDAITGRIESTATRAVLPPETIAKIADDIIKQRIQGNIVGWYHSHPGYGIFMSNVDVGTQTRLQQFSQYVTALIIDPLSDEVGFFTLDSSGRPLSIAPRHVHIFQEGEEVIPPEFEAPIEQPPIAPLVEEIVPPVIVPEKRKTTRYLLMVLLLIGTMLGGTFGAIFLLPDRTLPTIEPIDQRGWYGRPLDLGARVVLSERFLLPAKIAKVALYYRLANESTSPFKELVLKAQPKNLYNGTILGSEVRFDIECYFQAVTTAGISNKTDYYRVPVADFSVSISPGEWWNFAGMSSKFSVTINPLNHFESPRVSLKVNALSGVFDFKWTSGNLLSIWRNRPNSTDLIVQAGTGDKAYGNHKLEVSAESDSIVRRAVFKVAVPTFKIDVEPSAELYVSRTSTRTATVRIRLQSLHADIGNVTWGTPRPELPHVSYDFSLPWAVLQKDEPKYVTLSFTVSAGTPAKSYEIVLQVYAVWCPLCSQELRLVLHVT